MPTKFFIGLGPTENPLGTPTTVVGRPVGGVLGVGAADAGVALTTQYPPVPPQVDPTTVVESTLSRTAYHNTLFHNFQLSVRPVYNFFTADEGKTFVSDPSASLDSIPRYVELTWRRAPLKGPLSVSQKGIRPYLNPPPAPPAVVPMDVAVRSVANGYIAPGVINALVSESPVPKAPIVIDEDDFLFDPMSGGDQAARHVGDEDSPFAINSDGPPPEVIRVDFIDPSIAGTFNSNRLANATSDIHLTVAGSFAKIVGGMEVLSEFNQDVSLRNPPPTFPAPAQTPILSYVGYVIERHDLLPNGGMVVGRTIVLDDIEQDYFVDRQVVYGGVYVYRIRVVAQWVHPKTVGFDGKSTVDRLPPAADSVGTKVASYYQGDWCDWVRAEMLDIVPPAPPDELTVRPMSRIPQICVAWKMPEDRKRDIQTLHLLRAVVQNGSVSDWVELGQFVPTNGQFVDTAVVPSEKSHSEYIYAMYSTSFHGLNSVLGEQVMVRVLGPDVRQEYPLTRTAPIGGDPFEHPSLGDPLEGTDLVARTRARFYVREATSLHPLRDRDYVLDVRSLSTGERVQIVLNADSTDIISEDA